MSGGLSGSKSSGKSSSTTQIDKALVPLRGSILDQSMSLANQPIQAYGGERVAGFNPAQEQAMQQAIALGGQGQGLATKGFNMLGNLGTADQRIGAYMNPFTDEVINRSMSDIERQRQIQNTVSAGQALSNRAFGGSRQAVADSLNNENFARLLGDTSANLRMQGFNTALGAAQQDVNQQQGLAQALAQAGYGAIEGQSQAGAMQQAQQQAMLDSEREQFYEPTNLQMQKLDFLTGIASGVPQGGTTQGKQSSSNIGFGLKFGG